MFPLVVAAVSALGHAVFWFALAVFDLALIGYIGPEVVLEGIQKAGVRAKAAMQWAREYPIGFILEFIVSAAFAVFWLLSFLQGSNPEPLWLNVIISLSIFLSSLVWWPLMISWVPRHPAITSAFILVVLWSAMSLYFLTLDVLTVPSHSDKEIP